MISAWRRRKADRCAGKKQPQPDGNPNMEVVIPSHFRCPISLELMKDPVTLSTGITYDRESIEKWIETGNYTCPVTNQVLRNFDQIPNHAIRKMIQDWSVKNSSYGIERVPTPRIPVSPIEVSKILSRITAATGSRDEMVCRDLVTKIKTWGKESERNKRCIIANGSGHVLSAAFEEFAIASFEKHAGVLEEILSALIWMFPLDDEAQLYLGSFTSLHCMVWFSKCSDLSGRRNAILVLKQLLSLDQRHVDALAEIEEGIQALVKLIKEPICPTTTKATLMIIFYLVSTSPSNHEDIKTRFVEMGLVSLLLDILVDSTDRSMCEKALGVLDEICGCNEGRDEANHHALTIPVLVKKILRVSDMATEFSVSLLWKLCKNEKREEGGVLVEALQVGAFQKLLLLLQVGCCEKTKQKASELLKLMNLYRGRFECIDSMDFKNLKRPS
ncbi:hypothetical protein HHK36_024210 [Tetracentron sinense]|uniref:U-box domain-containing protein n=1 Tax=Tetracentron sinense TaxID=13715 RepID=A0A834YQ39_TETSI|nr:hypothetical protein HHK36_024210 [Tetracentron sinense]